ARFQHFRKPDELVAPPAFLANDLETFLQRASEKRRACRGVNVAAGALQDELDHRRGGGGEGPGSPGCLSQRPYVDDARRVQAEMLEHATAGAPKHAEAMRIID